MSLSLSAGQADELHKSILGYTLAHGKTTTATALRAELHLGDDECSPATAHKYGQLLEKKWTNVSRLEKRASALAAELEAQNAELESQLKDAVHRSNGQDPASWIPASKPAFRLESHSGGVNCVAFHPIFSSLASGSDDCTIKIWDWELGELERTIKAHTQAVRDVDFGGPQGAVLLASCSSDLTIKLWNPADNYNNIRTLNGHDHAINSVRFLPCTGSNRNVLVSASADCTIRLWDIMTGYCVKTLRGHSDWVRSMCPSSDGQLLLSTSSDKMACIWDIHSQNLEPIQTLVGHDKAINCCDFAPQSSHRYLSSLAGSSTAVPLSNATRFLATGSRDKTIKLWDVNGRCLATLVGHDSWVNALVFHPGGRYIFSVADDKTLRFWDLNQRGQCISIHRVHDEFITCLRWAATIKDQANQNANGPGLAVKGRYASAHFRCVIATGSMDKKVIVFIN